MVAASGDEIAVGARSHLRASQADREHVIEVLKVAFVQDRLSKDEFDVRVGQAFTSQTYAELATLTADLPAGLAVAQPRTTAPVQGWMTTKSAVTSSVCMVIPAAIATVIGGAVAYRVDVLGAFLLPFIAFLATTVAAGSMIGHAREENKRPLRHIDSYSGVPGHG